MTHHNTLNHTRRNRLQAEMARMAMAGFALLVAISLPLQAQTSTTTTNIAIGSSVLQPTVKHLGINLQMHNYWDSGQMMQNLVMENPGFEGEIYQSIIKCASGTTTTCVDSDTYAAWPAGFWNGATFEFIYGAANGSTGSVSSYTAGTGSQGGVFTFSSALSLAPATGDFVIVRQTISGNAAAGWWTTKSGNGAITTNTSDLPSGTTGTQTIALSAPTASDSATLDSYFDSTTGRSFIQLNGMFQVSFLAKATAGNNSVAVSVTRSGSPSYLSQTVPLTDSWQAYNLTFTAAETGSAVGTIDLRFKTVGQDSFYLDDVSLQQNSTPSNPTVFRDAVVSTLTALNPGVLRFWSGNQLGDTLDNLIAGPFGRVRSGFSAYSTSMTSIEYGLYDFLQLCQTIGAEPWFVVPSTFSTAEAANLIEYLASESTTTYGAKRAAQGQTAPWTSVFSIIHLEFGNEEWNSTFRGGSFEDPAVYGARAQAIFAAMRADLAYNASSFDLVLGGQAGNPWLNQQTQNATNNNDSFAIAPYMMNTVNTFDDNQDLFGPLLAEPQAFYSPSGIAEGVGSQYLTIGGVPQTVGGGMVYLDQLAIQNSTHPVPVAIYETNLSTLSGAITQNVINEFAPSIGAGLAEIENMLVGMSHGIITQNLWALPQWKFAISTAGGATTVPLWGAVIDMGGPTDLRRPQYLAIQLANQTIPSGATMLQTVQSGANPTWNQALVNSVQLNSAQYIQSFAFSNGTQSGLILLNLNLTSALPVTFSGASAPTGTVQVTELTSANITDTNESASVVAPVSSSQTFTSGTTLSLPTFSMTALTWSTQTGAAAPPVISNVQATAISASGATITWTTTTPASSEVLYGTTAAYGSSTTAVSTLVTSHSVTLTGLNAGTPYDFAAVSVDAKSNSVTSSNYTFTTLTGTPVISNVQATAISASGATITWTTTTPASSQVLYGTTAAYGSSTTAVSTLVTSHSVTLTGLNAGTPYDFAAVSVDAKSNSVTSTNYTFTTLTGTPVISNVQATAISGSGATITWTTTTPASSQVLYGTTAAYGSSTTAVSTLVTSHSVTLTGLNAGTPYDFAAVSVDAKSNSVTSSNYTFTTVAPPPVISGVQITAISTSGATITWTTSTPSSSKIVYGLTTSYGSTTPLVAALITVHSITLTGLAAGTPYDLAVVSVDTYGQSVTSSNYSFTTLAAALIISNVEATAITASGATITWTTSTPASSQVVYGTTAGYGSSTAAILTLVTSHSATLTGLNAGTVYDFAVASAPSGGQSTISSNYSFTTLADQASGTPVISNVQATAISATTATIIWTTSTPASSEVVYGTTTPWGGLSMFTPIPVTSHSVTLTGLTPSTGYLFAVESVGASGPWVVSSIYSFTTVAGPYNPSDGPPVISNVQATAITAAGATITWTTSTPSTSEVVYGLTTPWGGPSGPYSATPVTSHSVILTGLAAGTRYVFAVESVGATGPWVVSSIYSFTTLADTSVGPWSGPWSAPPVIFNVQATPSGTAATITWTTSTPASSHVVYGLTTVYGWSTPVISTPMTWHSVTLTGLTPGATYNFAVESLDPNGQSATSPNNWFTTQLSPAPFL